MKPFMSLGCKRWDVCMYLYVFREEVLMDDPSLLQIVHDVRQLVHVLQHSLRNKRTLKTQHVNEVYNLSGPKCLYKQVS